MSRARVVIGLEPEDFCFELGGGARGYGVGARGYGVGARGYGVGARGYGKLWVFDNLLLDHVGLPLVVVLTVHLVIFGAGWVKGIILRYSY